MHSKTGAAALMRSLELLWMGCHLITTKNKLQKISCIHCTDPSPSPLQCLTDLQGAFRFCMDELFGCVSQPGCIRLISWFLCSHNAAPLIFLMLQAATFLLSHGNVYWEFLPRDTLSFSTHSQGNRWTPTTASTVTRSRTIRLPPVARPPV